MNAEDARRAEIQRKLHEPISIEVEGFNGEPVTLTGVTIFDIQSQMREKGLSFVEPVKKISQAIERGLEPKE